MDPSAASAAPASTRVDKWLWAVRLFKTRTLAAEACRGGHVKIAGQPVKPSRDVAPGEVLSVQTRELTRTVRVILPIEKRVGPKLVSEAMQDLTPAEEYLRFLKNQEVPALPKRPKGAGRPTKKDRRALAKLAPERFEG